MRIFYPTGAQDQVPNIISLKCKFGKNRMLHCAQNTIYGHKYVVKCVNTVNLWPMHDPNVSKTQEETLQRPQEFAVRRRGFVLISISRLNSGTDMIWFSLNKIMRLFLSITLLSGQTRTRNLVPVQREGTLWTLFVSLHCDQGSVHATSTGPRWAELCSVMSGAPLLKSASGDKSLLRLSR